MFSEQRGGFVAGLDAVGMLMSAALASGGSVDSIDDDSRRAEDGDPIAIAP